MIALAEKKRSLISWVALGLVFLSACARAPLRGPDTAMRPAVSANKVELRDDLPLGGLLDAVESELTFFSKNPPKGPFVLGPRVYSAEEYLAGLRRFVALGRQASDSTAFVRSVREEFELFEVYGQSDWGEAFITSYYEPWVEGSRKPTSRFSQALYMTPGDLMSLDLGLFDAKFAGERPLRARLQGKQLLPYYSREEIDSKKALQGRGLEICYLDPLDAYFMQVQGSGVVRLEDGRELRINYAEKNGKPYESLGKVLRGKIPPDQINLHTIEKYLRTLPVNEMQSILNRNESYVFFQTKPESATTYLGVSATDGRTIATDLRYFPKGALAFLEFEKPIFDSSEALVPARSEKVGRFVLDQDIGGAITGGGRLDLFWGRGQDAKHFAGVMKSMGRLYYLGPKKTGSRLP